MKVQQLLGHYGIQENPFGQEDAQTDQVFKRHCLEGTYHPAWDKIYGSPVDPSTAIVFGEKGAGKTALRLQIVEQVEKHNREHPDSRVFVIEYDDFNPFLDCFRERLRGSRKKPEKCLKYWRLWDHMDALLSIGVTRLVDSILASGSKSGSGSAAGPYDVNPALLSNLSRVQQRDLLMLSAFYDRSLAMPREQRWQALRKKLRYSTWKNLWDLGLGIVGFIGLFAALWKDDSVDLLKSYWTWILLFAVWFPFLYRRLRLYWLSWRVSRQVRVLDHHPARLQKLLARFERQELADQPIPSRERSDDRYELIIKLQGVLRVLGFHGIIVLVDRVDEPHLINGSAERMRDLMWPMFDNKFLKHPGIGFKLLLPVEVSHYFARADKDFFERSRLDKQNLIRSLQWTGESLYGVANDRLRACAGGNPKTNLRELFDDTVTDSELISTLERLRVPRHMFKFLHRLLVDHCHRYTDDNPRWQIARETLQSSLALYLRDLQEFDRGQGTG